MPEVASAFVTIAPSAKGFGSKLNSQIGGEVDSSGKKTGARFGSAMKIGALAALGGVALLGGFLKGAVDQASGLNEAGTKITAIFGKQGSAAVQQFADKGAKALGQNRLAVLDSAATFGTMGKAAGLGGKDLAKFSTGFATLSTDLASFNNSTPQEATEALGAALRGEAEPIRKFGVLLDDATLKGEAMKLGLISTTKEALTPAQKVLAAQAAIYKQTGDAQGDFQKTSGGLANQQRILSASFTDLQGKVGSALLPIVTRFVSFLNTSMMPALSALGGFLTSTIGPAFAAIGGLFSGGAGGGILASLTGFGTAIRASLLPVLQTVATTFKTVILPAVTSFVSYVATSLFPVFTQVAGIVTGKVLPILSSLAQFFYSKVIPAVVAVAQSVGAKLKPIFEQLVATFRTKVLPAVVQILDRFREWQPTIQKVILVMVKIIGKVLEFAASILGKVLPPVIRFAGYLLANVVPAVLDFVEVVAKIIQKVIAFGGALVDGVRDAGKFLTGVKDKIGAALTFVAGIPDKIVGYFEALGAKMYAAGGKLMGMLASGIKAAVLKPYNELKAAADKLKGLLPGSPIKEGPLKPWNSGQPGEMLMEFLAKGIAKGGEKTRKALESELDKLKSSLSTMKSDFASLAESVSSSFTGDLFGATATAADAEAGVAGSSVGQNFIAGLTAKKGELTALLTSFKTLKGWGIPASFLSQLFASGNGALITELAGMGRSGAVGAANLFGDVQSLGSQLGNAVATNDYGPDIRETTAQIKELRADIAGLPKKTAKENAKEMGNVRLVLEGGSAGQRAYLRTGKG